jgi:hypothetical protein
LVSPQCFWATELMDAHVEDFCHMALLFALTGADLAGAPIAPQSPSGTGPTTWREASRIMSPSR